MEGSHRSGMADVEKPGRRNIMTYNLLPVHVFTSMSTLFKVSFFSMVYLGSEPVVFVMLIVVKDSLDFYCKNVQRLCFVPEIMAKISPPFL